MGRAARETFPRILVTGADGFIGRVVCDSLLTRGFAVRRAVRRAAGEPIDDTQVIGSLEEYRDWTALTSGIDAIVHLANLAHRPSRPDNQALSVNVGGTLSLASEAVRNGVRRFVYVSSAHVNGLATLNRRPFLETDTPAPAESYAISKWEAERALRQLGRESGLQVTIVRPPLVYGPRVKGNMLALLRFVRAGWPLPFGSIQNLRSFVGVQNLSDLLVRCIDHPAANGGLFLIADGEDVSTPDLIQRIATAMGRRSRLFHCPKSVLGVAATLCGRRAAFESITGCLQVDASHARQTLDWRPRVTLQDGLQMMAEWFMHEGA